ncbi:PepSY domain-containing protein [Persicobacter sp. CCB-QB2]|uniref:PepSY-associated TM helix domain-containing protein n=1 Tax=Persicobacter sp. CCB-QB2 TaxID=1561025 RepID=UPI0006A96DCD|nr:PepSY-associated TM helix domain-containing protein [Persicobacter sp. CCB-QB2]
MTFKKFLGQLHLILGLMTGLVVFIVSITGCIYAFEHEIQEISQPYRWVKEKGTQMLPPSKIKEIALEATDGMLVRRIYYEHPETSAIALHYADDAPYYYLTFIDQYTGEVLKVKNLEKDFFTIILYLHISLLLPYGKEIIGVSTLLFLVLLISGLYLWFPRNKNKKAVRQKFKIKWKASWRRQNYDLHSVLGFYACWILIFSAITGLVWSFEWFEKSYYYLLSGGDHLKKSELQSKVKEEASINTPMVDRVWQKVLADDPEILGITIYLPISPEEVITTYSSPDYGTYGRLDWRYFDQFTMEEYPALDFRGRHEDATVAQKIMKLNYDIHTGGILGLAGKFLMFFASLISASLPVTGFLLWRGRSKKKRQKSSHRQEKIYS